MFFAAGIRSEWPWWDDLHLYWRELPNYNPQGIQSSEPGTMHTSEAANLFLAADEDELEELEYDLDAGGEDEQDLDAWDSRGGSPVDEDAIPVSYIYFLKGILLIQPQWDATPINKDAIETIKVQGKESGLWFTRRKDAEPRNVEESVPIQRPPLTNSNSMWLLRKPLVEEPVEEPVAESVKPAAPARRERSMTTSSFWPARMNTKDELKKLPCTPPKQVITKSPSPSRSSTSDGGQGKNFNYNYSQGWCDQN